VRGRSCATGNNFWASAGRKGGRFFFLKTPSQGGVQPPPSRATPLPRPRPALAGGGFFLGKVSRCSTRAVVPGRCSWPLFLAVVPGRCSWPLFLAVVPGQVLGAGTIADRAASEGSRAASEGSRAASEGSRAASEGSRAASEGSRVAGQPGSLRGQPGGPGCRGSRAVLAAEATGRSWLPRQPGGPGCRGSRETAESALARLSSIWRGELYMGKNRAFSRCCNITLQAA